MAGTLIDRTDPTFDDLGRREVINLRCKCGREVQVAPFQLRLSQLWFPSERKLVRDVKLRPIDLQLIQSEALTGLAKVPKLLDAQPRPDSLIVEGPSAAD
jgi:hypothetical protein